MSNDNLNIEKAISDVALIRQMINKNDINQYDSHLAGVTLDANLLMQGIGFFGALALIFIEIMSNQGMTSAMLVESKVEELRIMGISAIGATLLGLLIPIYFILWRAARHNGEEIGHYIARNFRYMRNLSFVSDLLMKFVAIALVLLAEKPEWVAVLLTAFTGDYLMQGRFFTLTTKLSMALGLACFALAMWLFISGTAALVIPLIMFAVISGISLTRLFLRYQSLQTAEAQVK